MNIMAVGKKITRKTEKGKQYNLPYHISDINWGKGEGDENFGG